MAALALVIAALALVLHWASVALVLGRFTRALPLPAPRDWPFVTLLRPVCGLDPFDAETLATSFGLDYPGYEVIFCVARADDPVVALIERLIADHPGIPARLLIGDDGISRNPKLNNLAKGWRAARGDWIAMADANLILPADYLRQLVSLSQPGVGLVSSPPMGARAEGLWGAVELAFLNGNQARLQLAADELGIGFAQGKTLFWHRPVLEAGGGLPALGHEMAEDLASTKLVRAQGLRVRLAQRPFAQPIGRRSLAAVWGRQLRWSVLRRDGFPALWAAEVMNSPLVPGLLVLVAAPPVAALFPLAWYGAEAVLARTAGWPMRPRDLIAWVLRDLMIPALWLATWGRRGFEWRGTAMAGAKAANAEAAR